MKLNIYNYENGKKTLQKELEVNENISIPYRTVAKVAKMLKDDDIAKILSNPGSLDNISAINIAEMVLTLYFEEVERLIYMNVKGLTEEDLGNAETSNVIEVVLYIVTSLLNKVPSSSANAASIATA